MASEQPRGILRNRDEAPKQKSISAEEQLDRKEVIANTRLNAQLASESSKGEELRAKIAAAKKQEDGGQARDEHLKWDEVNLYKTEQEKSSTMKIDEPKTPYSEGFNPEGEYYRDDADEEEIPSFNLGEGEFDAAKTDDGHRFESLNGGEILKDETAQNADEEAEEEAEGETSAPETAEEKHKRFEELRKAHYHMKGNALKQSYQVSDDEEE